MGDENYKNNKPRIENRFSIIENTNEAQEEYGRYPYGYETYGITRKQIRALLDGKQLASDINLGEYAIFVVLDEEDDENESV